LNLSNSSSLPVLFIIFDYGNKNVLWVMKCSNLTHRFPFMLGPNISHMIPCSCAWIRKSKTIRKSTKTNRKGNSWGLKGSKEKDIKSSVVEEGQWKHLAAAMKTKLNSVFMSYVYIIRKHHHRIIPLSIVIGDSNNL